MQYPGKYKGFVRDNADPQGRCRVRVYCPQVMGPVDDKDHWLGWAEACLPWLGGIDTRDFQPPYTKEQNGGEDVGVWIEFEGGNPDFPVWTGMQIYAPTVDGVHSVLPVADAGGTTGGSILDNPPTGSSVDAISPPRPAPGEKEVRLLVKQGLRVVIGSAKGGYLTIDASGVHVTGPMVTANGRHIDANLDKVVG